MEDPDVYLDYYTRRTLKVIRLRNNFARLAIGLLEEGKRDSAMAVVDRCMELLPAEKLAHDIYSTRLVDAYFLGGNTEKANLLMDSIFVQVDKELRYYYSLPGIKGRSVETDKRMSLQILQELLTLARTYNQTEQTTKMEPVFAEFYQRLMGEITPGS